VDERPARIPVPPDVSEWASSELAGASTNGLWCVDRLSPAEAEAGKLTVSAPKDPAERAGNSTASFRVASMTGGPRPS